MPFAHRRATLSKYPDTTASDERQWTRAYAPIMGPFFPWSGLNHHLHAAPVSEVGLGLVDVGVVHRDDNAPAIGTRGERFAGIQVG